MTCNYHIWLPVLHIFYFFIFISLFMYVDKESTINVESKLPSKMSAVLSSLFEVSVKPSLSLQYFSFSFYFTLLESIIIFTVSNYDKRVTG